MKWVHNLNERVADSVVGKYFHLKERKSTFTTELRAGLVCFLTTSYILAVNSGILSDTGGTCTDADCTGPKKGQPGCRFTDPGFQTCVQEVRRSIITATAATSLMACFLMGAVANMPLAVAPGMGINAYFAYTVVGFYGTGMITYQEALAAVFIEGWIFIAISLTGVRGRLVSLVPKSIMLATAGGIGLFLAFIGLQNSEGIGLVTYNSATLGKRLHLATLWLGVVGLLVMVMLMARKVKGAIMFGIVFTTFVSWIPGHQASYLGAESPVPGGADRMAFFKNVVSVPDARKTTLAWSFAAFGRSELWVALITFLYLDFLDATGTLFSMATMLNQRMPGFVNDKDKSFPRQLQAFCVDGVAIVIGSLLGCAPLTVYIESASGPALILVGAMMMENLVDIDWADVRHAIPAFITIVCMPLTYSIAYGVIAGVCSYMVVYFGCFLLDLVDVALGKQNMQEVLFNNCPDAFQDKMKKPVPFKSPSVVLQEHINPEHATHFAAVASGGSAKDVQQGLDLPVSDVSARVDRPGK
eukprot:gene5975-6214_t